MFKKYCHIENTYQETMVDYAMSMGWENLECICTVKIDGSNFQVDVDNNDQVSFGTRNRELGRDEDFSGWQRVMQKLDVEKKALAVKKSLDCSEITIFGELCGGLYRHKDVPKVKEAVRIQGRIDYSPDNEWIVFDILADGKWLSQPEVEKICRENGLPCVKTLFKGTLRECLNFPCEFLDTTGHDLWGLPIVEKNTAEGVVIKPLEDIRDNRGNRVIFKNKNPKYKERIRETKANASPGLNCTEQLWEARFEEYLTESRVYSVLSKLGQKPEFSTIMKSMVEDAENDLKDDFSEELAEVERTMDPKDFDFSKIRKAATKKAVAIVRPVYLKQL